MQRAVRPGWRNVEQQYASRPFRAEERGKKKEVALASLTTAFPCHVDTRALPSVEELGEQRIATANTRLAHGQRRG